MSTRALDGLLYIPRMIIRRIVTKKLEMVCVVLTWVSHMLTGDKMCIRVENTSKFLGLIAEDSTYLNQEVMYDEVWVHQYDMLSKWESEHWKKKSEPREKKVWQ